MRKLVVLSGAGMSAESGLKTFRDAGGLWEGHRIEEVASPEGWMSNPNKVLDFYNQRRRQLVKAEPNDGHKNLLKLEERYDVRIITQNVDNLHERAGSSHVIHLHGELMKCRCSREPEKVYDMKGAELNWGDHCDLGHQLRPHIVWFGEEVPMMERAAIECLEAEILVVIGTSLQVYPAAGLVNYVPSSCERYLIDPGDFHGMANFRHIQAGAVDGSRILVKELMD